VRSQALSAVALCALVLASCRAQETARPTRDARLAADDPRALAELEAARDLHETDPASEENLIWLGRRLAYLGRYDEAIDVYTRGLALWPDSHRLLRHRGHRYITTRRFDLAEADLERASELVRERAIPDEVEPDGRPNAAGIPRSTTNSNSECHLALALYLQGRFDDSLAAWQRCLDWSRVNDDMLVAATHWLTMTQRRLGRDADAGAALEAIDEDMEILENTSYHRLLLAQKGLLDLDEVLAEAAPDSVDRATRGYGVANLRLVDGRVDDAARLCDEVLASGADRAAFGVIAAEVERERLRWLR
jgi:tetratricopeptide (TPR) repeat protein